MLHIRQGELPQSAISFFDALKTNKPDLSLIRFSVFGLGNKMYGRTCNHESMILMNALIEARAQRIGERGLHNASGMEDMIDITLPWTRARIAEAEQYFS